MKVMTSLTANRYAPKKALMLMIKASLTSILLATSWFSCATTDKPSVIQAQISPTSEIKKALFIGNSFSFYNNGVHNYLGSLIRASGEWKVGENRLRLSTLSGGHLYEHLDDIDFLLTKPKGTWEAIVLQGHSNEAISPKKQSRFEKSVEKAVSKIKAAKLQPILLMTWGYKGQSDMGIELANAYTSLANKLDILVVPVGLAFWAAEKTLPNIELFVPDVLGSQLNASGTLELTYREDLKHPSTAGTYLMACVLYSTFYQKPAQGNIFTAGLDPDVAKQLQKLSWSVVDEFYKK